MKNILPPNWSWVKLEDVGEIVAGGTPSTLVNEYFDGEIAWITPADLTGYSNKYISKGRRNISIIGLKNSSARIVPKGSILFSSRAPIGYVAIASNDICTNQGFKILVPNKKVDSEFVYYYLKSAKQLAEKNASGTTFKEISSTNFKQLPIPLPPLLEQKKIVKKIEELFSGLDSGIASLKKAKEQLRIYRQSVLAHAFSGKLTEEVKGETKNGELPEGWKWVKLGELSELITKGASPRWQGFEYVSDQTQTLFVTSENVRDNYLDISKPKYLEDSFNEKQKRSILKKGDVLFNLVGASIGRATVFNIDIKSNINQAVAVIRLKDKLKNNYLSYYLNSESAKKYYMNEVVDFARANLSLTDTSNIPIPYCPLAQQTQIVEEIESRFAGSEALEKAIDESLTKAETLRQSILKKAFEGKLV